MTIQEMKDKICELLLDKHGLDVVAIKVDDKTTVCDYFIIATGRSSSQVRALAENVVEKMDKDYDVKPIHTDGVRDGKWAVIDFGAIMVHVFYDQVRMFYNLEKLWASDDGGNVEIFKDEVKK
ncbi:MAG: ribosome silencing factor [Acidaminococcus sp.]|nr:ribosome silencing factor [Acidaminococcus sp.]MDD7398092.1 ribosome silencing factor [Bacillota bacterium]MDY4560043.1 ribosome silencing factor [Eubacteriales bacterium]MDY5345118.1 ribosome silencing factor [Eubacteriales bacterium]